MNGNGSDDAGEPIAEALRLLDLFASVGAEAFDITHTNLQQEKRGFRPAQSLAQARQSMPYLVPSAARRQNNLIVRPRAGDWRHPGAARRSRTRCPGQHRSGRIPDPAHQSQGTAGLGGRHQRSPGLRRTAQGRNRRRQGSVRRHSCRRHRQFQTRLRPELPSDPDRRCPAWAPRHYADPRRDGGGRAGPAGPGGVDHPPSWHPPAGYRPANGPATRAASRGRRSAPAVVPSAPARILSGARSRSPGATASKRPPNGCWKKASRPARTAKPMPGRPPSMPTTPPGNATPCHRGDRPGDEER
jgi:hypothetical protein